MPNLKGVKICFDTEGIKPNFSELARTYGIDRRTIKKKWEGVEVKTTRNRSSKLDPYKDIIIEKFAINGVNKKAVYMYLIMNIDANIGSYSNFRKYISKHPEITERKDKIAHVLFETEYGKQLQFDWKGPITLHTSNGEEISFYIFSATLSASRFHVFRYSNFMTRECVIKSLIETFDIIGGIPQEALTDNMSSIISHSNGNGFCSEFTAFTKDMGITAHHCKAYHAYTKGKDESCNRFVTWILPYDKEFKNEEELIKIIAKFNIMVNKEVNQTTNMPPLTLFAKEKEYLNPLPNRTIIDKYLDTLIPVKVANTSLFYYKGNRYSVPRKYINQIVKIKETDNKLYVYYNKDLITMHEISDKKINYHEEDYIDGLASAMPEKDMNFVKELAEKNLKLFDSLNEERRKNNE